MAKKKKARRGLQKTVKKIKRAFRDVDAPNSLAVGTFALGGLVTALASDEEIRRQARALAGVTLDRARRFLMGEGSTDPSAEEQGDRDDEDSRADGQRKHAH